MMFIAAAAVAICWVSSVPVSAQVRLDNLVGDTSVCGARGDRVVECGSSNTNRPDLCCDGLMCSARSGGNLHMRCWTPEEVATEDMEPGAVPPPAPVPAPTLATVVVAPPVSAVNGVCAGEGERSVQCGASFGRPPTCCQGFVCTPGSAKVRKLERYIMCFPVIYCVICLHFFLYTVICVELCMHGGQ